MWDPYVSLLENVFHEKQLRHVCKQVNIIHLGTVHSR